MRDLKKISLTVVIALSSAFIAVWAYSRYFDEPNYVTVNDQQAVRYASLASAPQGEVPDLTYAAENSVHAVVHVKVTSEAEVPDYYNNNPFFQFFNYGDRYQNQQPQLQQSSGSGVIISSDGYIVTNNHVVDDADAVEIVLNDNRKFTARIIGLDESTDLALLKIDENDLPTLKFGNSDALKLGEWVLAVGNPFNLTSTVTAGIVSAKGRSIGVNTADMSIEAFVQTDAAVNPGNSGGALVNMNGELVGINTAIATQTGTYSGYSFAIPSSIVEKVVADLKKYGTVQRALLGVSITGVTSELVEQQKLNVDKIEGVYISGVNEGSGAEQAGLKNGDIILNVDGAVVNTASELQIEISKHKPGDVVKVLIKRDNKSQLYNVTLRNMRGDTEILTASDSKFLGASFDNVSDNEKYNLRISHGIKIADLEKGELKDAGLSEGFIITYANKEPVDAVNDLEKIVKKAEGRVLIEGVYSNGNPAYVVISSQN